MTGSTSTYGRTIWICGQPKGPALHTHKKKKLCQYCSI